MEDPLKIVLVQGTNHYFEILEDGHDLQDKILFCADEIGVSCYLIPLHYSDGLCQNDTDMIRARNFAIELTYFCWCKSNGRKRNAKLWYNSTPFRKVIEDLKFYKADYLIMDCG